LIYGSPVPGYQAPQDTIPPATRIPVLIGAILRDGYGSGDLPAGDPLPEPLPAELTRVADVVAAGIPPQLMARGMAAWTQLFGMLSFELFGQFNNVIDNRTEFFDHQLRAAFPG
jgi:hypothetical protein